MVQAPINQAMIDYYKRTPAGGGTGPGGGFEPGGGGAPRNPFLTPRSTT